MDNSFILEMHNITKNFPGVKALDDVEFSLKKGEVAGLVGENGAGKSTLMNILGGIFRQDNGEIILNDKKISVDSPSHAQSLGIYFIHQEPKLFLNRSVLSNIFVNQFPNNGIGFIPFSKIKQQANRILNSLGIGHINPLEIVENLNVGERRLVEIARAMVDKDVRILILDEPTASIGAKETDILFSIIKNLLATGVSIIYISHRLEEVFKICDRITILRNGRKVQTKEVKNTNIVEVISLITGKETVDVTWGRNQPTEKIIDVINYSGDGFNDISISFRRGEIVSLTGLLGSGCFEFVRSLFGIGFVNKGSLIINGKERKYITNSIQSVKHGISFLSDDRKVDGIFADKSVLFNLTLASLRKYLRFLFLSPSKQKKFSGSIIKDLSIGVRNINDSIKNLSGGNQQKTIIGRSLLSDSNVFIFCFPTQGIDVGGKREILKIIQNLANNGKMVIIVSDELEEIINVSHRIIVFRDGYTVSEFEYPNFNKAEILNNMVGGVNG